jgi:hypothetical protein
MADYTLDTSLARETWAKLDAFTQGYVECAMFTLAEYYGRASYDWGSVVTLRKVTSKTRETQ